MPPFHYITDHRCPHLHIYPADVLMVINSLNVNKSVGPDGISNKMLQLAGPYISQSLAKLFNNSLNTSSFPAAWKQANITPVHKKGDRQTITNYRPISLLSNISKVFERLVFNHLYTYLISNDLLTPKNAGYKKKSSTVRQLLDICQKIYKGIDSQKEVRMVFLDASKAFDRVWHAGLLFN